MYFSFFPFLKQEFSYNSFTLMLSVKGLITSLSIHRSLEYKEPNSNLIDFEQTFLTSE